MPSDEGIAIFFDNPVNATSTACYAIQNCTAFD